MTSNDEYVLQLLTERGYLTDAQVATARESMKAENETTLDALVAGNAVDEDIVLGTIADQFSFRRRSPRSTAWCRSSPAKAR